MRLKTLTLAAFGMAMMASAASAATLSGDTVGCGIVPGSIWSCSSATAVVGMGDEFQLNLGANPFFDVDIGASSIRLDFADANGLVAGAGEIVTFSDLDFSPASIIVGIANFLTDASSGVAATDISFGVDSISFDFNGTQWRQGQFVSFDIVTREVAAVPLPAALPLLAAGLGTFGVMGWRRKRKTQATAA